MGEMTLDQQRAMAMASARMRMAEAGDDAPVAPDKGVKQPETNGSGTFPGEGLLRGMYDPFTGLAQTVYNALPKSVASAGDKINDFIAEKTGMLPKIGKDGFNAAIAKDESNYQLRRGGGIDAQRIAGNVISPINAAMALKLPQAAAAIPRIAQGAGMGSLQSMLMPVTQGNYADEKIKQGSVGALVGGAIPIATGSVARIISPKASVNADIALLKSKGVNPTIGQTLGGIANTAEQKATSLFGVGDSIKNAREGARNQFNRAILNDSLESVGGKVDDIGHAGVKQAGDAISSVYDDALKGIKGVSFDDVGKQQLSRLQSMSDNMPDTTRNQFGRIMDSVMFQRMSPKQGMTAETFKIVDSELGAKAAKYSQSAMASERELGDALIEAQKILRDQAARQNPVYAEALSNANAAWAKLVRVEGAAKSSSLNDGVFTPGQYLGSVKTNSTSVRKRDFSRGTALGQDLGSAGQRVLGNTYPDSGTAGRMMPLLQGGALVANPILAAGGTAAGMAAYSPAIQKALVASITSRGKSAPITAENIRKLAPILNPLGIGLLNQRN